MLRVAEQQVFFLFFYSSLRRKRWKEMREKIWYSVRYRLRTDTDVRKSKKKYAEGGRGLTLGNTPTQKVRRRELERDFAPGWWWWWWLASRMWYGWNYIRWPQEKRSNKKKKEFSFFFLSLLLYYIFHSLTHSRKEEEKSCVVCFVLLLLPHTFIRGER